MPGRKILNNKNVALKLIINGGGSLFNFGIIGEPRFLL